MVNCERCHRKFASYAALKQHYTNQHTNVAWPQELQRQLVAEKEVQFTSKASLRPRGSSSWKIAIAVVLILIVAGAAWYVVSPGSQSSTVTGDPTLSTCINDATVLAEHIHPHLEIVIVGTVQTIPANIGITDTCQRPVHTHDTSGEIHVESPVVYPYTVHDFFLVWGQPFDNTQIMQYKVDSTHTLTMTVNGVPNSQFQNYVMQDGVQIVISYTATG